MTPVLANQARSRKLSVAATTILVFLALGPPIGSIMMGGIAGYLPWMLGPDAPGANGVPHSEARAALLLLGLAGIPASYWWGGLQALLTGLAVAAYGVRWGMPPIWIPCAAAVLAYGSALALGIRFSNHATLGMLLVHIISALVCWAIVLPSWLRIAR